MADDTQARLHTYAINQADDAIRTIHRTPPLWREQTAQRLFAQFRADLIFFEKEIGDTMPPLELAKLTLAAREMFCLRIELHLASAAGRLN